MLKVKTQVLRKDHRFLDPETKEILEEFPSISKAKKESRIRQEGNGGMGRGYVQVLDTRAKKVETFQAKNGLSYKNRPVKVTVSQSPLPKLSVGDVSRLVSLLKTTPAVAKRTISTRLKRPTRGDY